MGGTIGNQNARVGSIVRGAIRRALAENEAQGRESLLNIARKLISDAEAGDLAATKELFDRLDGKATQTIGGSDDHPGIKGVLEFVSPG